MPRPQSAASTGLAHFPDSRARPMKVHPMMAMHFCDAAHACFSTNTRGKTTHDGHTGLGV
jgi:hypothetical protein